MNTHAASKLSNNIYFYSVLDVMESFVFYIIFMHKNVNLYKVLNPKPFEHYVTKLH